MKPSEQIKPISYVKAHASEIINNLKETHAPVYITQNGEAAAVLQDIESYEKMQESLALMKIISMSEQQVREGKVQSVESAFEELDAYIAGLE